MSNEFLDRVSTASLASSLLPTVRRCEIRCDAEGCKTTITVSHDIDETQAAAIVRAAGWQAKQGAYRFSHHCGRHADVKR